MELVDQLEKDEDLKLEQFELGKDHLVISTIVPDPAKLKMDITVPTLTPILVRKKTLAEEIAALDVGSFRCPPFPMKEGTTEAKNFRYEGYDVITMEKLVEREYAMPEPQTAQEVISYYAKRIAQDVKLPTQFAALAPKVREFLATRAFGKPVELEGKEMIHAISSNVARYVTVDLFVKALRALVVEEQVPPAGGVAPGERDARRFPTRGPRLCRCQDRLQPGRVRQRLRGTLRPLPAGCAEM